MKELWIENYIRKLTVEDVIKFASANQIFLSKEEADFIYFNIKENWRTLLFGDPTLLFYFLKENLNGDTYTKMISLYQFYKQKYQSFL